MKMLDRHTRDIFSLINENRIPIMGVAALCILLYHEYQSLFANQSLILHAQEWVRGFGFIGVDIFILLSGMGLPRSREKHTLAEFYFRRIKRIIIPFFVVAIVVAFVDGWSIIKFAKNVLFINFFSESIWSFLWFVPAIIVLYFLFPAYYKFFKMSGNKYSFTLIVCALWILILILGRNVIRPDFYCFLNRIPVFVIGILFGWISQKKETIIDRTTWILLHVLLVFSLSIITLILFFDLPIPFPFFELSVPSVIMAVSIVMLLALVFSKLNKNRICRSFISFLSFYGTISFELYCVQEFVGEKTVSFLSDKTGRLVINLSVFAVVTVLAFLLNLLNKKIWTIKDKRKDSTK